MRKMKFITLIFAVIMFPSCASQSVAVTKNKEVFDKNSKKVQNEMHSEDKEKLFRKYINYALICISHEDLDSALEYIKEAEKYKTKDTPEFYELRGSVYEGLGNETQAFKDYYKAMMLYFNCGNYEKALEMVSSLESIRFGDPKLLEWEKKIKQKLYEKRMEKLRNLNKTSNESLSG